MARYGFGYLGSKSEIADEIIGALPRGRRFVDLFGGGFAMSHCALLSYKYDKVLYNDINPLTVQLLKDALSGKYNYDVFKPKWVSRDEFHGKKNTDGYIKWCWSFSNDGKTYLYGKEIEEIKHACHDFCVFGKPINGTDLFVESNEIKTRRLAIIQYFKNKYPQTMELQHLQRIENLQKLENLESQNLEIACMDYRQYHYHNGDVVYCDIPYQNSSNKNSDDYGDVFDSGAFYAWAVSRSYPVYFSSYKLGGIVWERKKTVKKNLACQRNVRTEVLYCVNDDYIEPEKIYQGTLFERQI